MLALNAPVHTVSLHRRHPHARLGEPASHDSSDLPGPLACHGRLAGRAMRFRLPGAASRAAARQADEIVSGDAVLRAPFPDTIKINRVRQVPQGLVGRLTESCLA